jgi:hypothetical protein
MARTTKQGQPGLENYDLEMAVSGRIISGTEYKTGGWKAAHTYGGKKHGPVSWSGCWPTSR